MLETAQIVQFQAGTSSGRTKPSRVTCLLPDGSYTEVVAKFSAGCDRGEGGLAIETIAACLATDLGLPVPKAYLLSVDAEWIDTVTDDERRDLIRASSSRAFGSKHLGNGFHVWSGGDTVGDAIIADAAAIFAFDCFTVNHDRRSDNPNCLVKGTQMGIFDHELSFVYKGIIGWQRPWVLGALASFTSPGKHIFFEGLHGADVDLEPVAAAWRGITNERLKAYRDTVPVEWAGAADAVNNAIELIEGVRDNIAAAVAEVRRVLS